MQDKGNKSLESLLANRRIRQLQNNPISGNFDTAHLKETHRYIFQDFPQEGLWNYGSPPGEFRPPVMKGLDWIKNRRLESINSMSCVTYSRMDKTAQEQLAQILESANPAALRKRKTTEFTEAIGKLYAAADYIHPFSEGNSRTLRVFTRQLAEVSGYRLDWERFNEQTAGRDILYIARDLSVNTIALPNIQNLATKRDVYYTHTLDVFGGNRDLPNLLRDAIRPARAVDFERLPENEALAIHPELSRAYAAFHTAEKYFQDKMPGKPNSQRQALALVKTNIQTHLDAGETDQFYKSWKPTKDKTKASTSPKKQIEPDRER